MKENDFSEEPENFLFHAELTLLVMNLTEILENYVNVVGKLNKIFRVADTASNLN